MGTLSFHLEEAQVMVFWVDLAWFYCYLVQVTLLLVVMLKQVVRLISWYFCVGFGSLN